ncbi:MAG: DinB family protein [Phycisphaerales bacterium JB059]
MTRRMTMQLIEGIEPDRFLTRGCDGGNHTAYILGHIAWTDDQLLSSLGDRPSALPEGWAERFGMNVDVSDDAAHYPDKDALVQTLIERRSAMVGWLGSLSPAALSAPIEGEMSAFVANRGALVGLLTFHESFHAGQVSVCRRAIGLPRLF